MRGVFLFGGMNLKKELEERIREIVREEMAAREERREAPSYLSEDHLKLCEWGLAKPC